MTQKECIALLIESYPALKDTLGEDASYDTFEDLIRSLKVYEESSGGMDFLIRFVVQEIKETWDDRESTTPQCAGVAFHMERAADELQRIANAFHDKATGVEEV